MLLCPAFRRFPACMWGPAPEKSKGDLTTEVEAYSKENSFVMGKWPFHFPIFSKTKILHVQGVHTSHFKSLHLSP